MITGKDTVKLMLADKLRIKVKNRFCVFCGKPPENKNKEHVLPQWLIELTGAPNRVVNFGINYENNKVINFAWSQFVVPACEACNSSYSDLENQVKPLIEKTLSREAIKAKEWIIVFNWLDKVRVGLWLAYHLIQKNPTQLEPRYFIDNRINTKDRMLCVYPVKNNRDGLNGFGAETLLFHRNPSSIALRINDIIIINMSSDSLFLGRCGFPFPKTRRINLEKENEGTILTSNYAFTEKIKHPILRQSIIKPSVHLYQPIIQTDINGNYPEVDSSTEYLQSDFIKMHTIKGEEGHGILFRQFSDKVIPIYDKNELIEFDEINQSQSRPLYKILAQVFDFQIYCHQLNEVHCSDKQIMRNHIEKDKMLIKINKILKSRHLQEANKPSD